MLDSKRTYVVLDFSTIGQLGELYNQFSRNSIIEVAAVKIKEGIIIGHFSTFVAIENFDPHKLEFDGFRPNAVGITNLHLIGAPKFENVCQRVFDYTENCTLVVESLSKYPYNDFNIFKDSAMNCGYVFNQPVIAFNDLLYAEELRGSINDKTLHLDQMPLDELSVLLRRKKPWLKMLEERDIYIFDEQTFEKRGGPLTYALAIAQILTDIIKEEEDRAEEVRKMQQKDTTDSNEDTSDKILTNDNGNSENNIDLEAIDDKPPF